MGSSEKARRRVIRRKGGRGGEGGSSGIGWWLGVRGLARISGPCRTVLFLFKNQWPTFKVEESYNYILLSVHCVGGGQER